MLRNFSWYWTRLVNHCLTNDKFFFFFFKLHADIILLDILSYISQCILSTSSLDLLCYFQKFSVVFFTHIWPLILPSFKKSYENQLLVQQLLKTLKFSLNSAVNYISFMRNYMPFPFSRRFTMCWCFLPRQLFSIGSFPPPDSYKLKEVIDMIYFNVWE